jgi:hypothetical protein
VLQLSDTENDPEGWTAEEIASYDGWGHDSSRQWRNVEQWESEGVVGFRKRFGAKAFGLNHRFYFHFDDQGGFWLSAEDGCEGRAADASPKR